MNFTVIWHFVRGACELIDIFVLGVGAGEAAPYVLKILWAPPYKIWLPWRPGIRDACVPEIKFLVCNYSNCKCYRELYLWGPRFEGSLVRLADVVVYMWAVNGFPMSQNQPYTLWRFKRFSKEIGLITT